MVMAHNRPADAGARKDRLLRERNHDTYKLRAKLKEPTQCPRCSAVFRNGRWQHADDRVTGAHEQMCSACSRIEDNYPAGEVTLTGELTQQQIDEITSLARNLEGVENAEHPLNRIIAIKHTPNQLLITTTDVHLPRRIGKSIQRAFGGELDIHFDEEGYFTSVSWSPAAG